MIGLDTSSLDRLNFRLEYNDVVRAPKATQDWLRLQCQTNLRFLSNCVLRPRSEKFLPLTERVHGPVIDSFLRPIPGVAFNRWSPVKERVTMVFRGGLKSTIHGAFLVQVQLCDPDIRVLVLSGKLTHAQTIMNTGSRPFVSNEVLRFLFPEWAADEEELSKGQFVCPKRSPEFRDVQREPTLSIATFESTKAGGHYELLDFDDCTNEINCATPELVDKNVEHYDDTDPLVEPGGYRHLLATRWAPDDTDLPEVIKQRGQENSEVTGENDTTYLAIPVWTVRTDGTPEEVKARQEREKRHLLREADVILTWPEKMTWRYLYPKYRANPIKFLKQYLLRYTVTAAAESFTKDLMLSVTRPYHEGMPRPHDRFLVIHWDLSGVYSGRVRRTESDTTVGFAAMFELSTRRVFFYDAVIDVFNSSSEMAQAIVGFFARQLRVNTVGACSIEDRGGARYLQGEIVELAKRLQVPVNVAWLIQPSVKDIKNTNIALLAGAVRRGLVQFSTNLPYRDDIFRQFEKWAPHHKNVRDDAPDCAAQVWYHYSDKIFPGVVENLRPSEQTFFEPELQPGLVTAVDPHADERENADLELLSRMTVGHV